MRQMGHIIGRIAQYRSADHVGRKHIGRSDQQIAAMHVSVNIRSALGGVNAVQ